LDPAAEKLSFNVHSKLFNYTAEPDSSIKDKYLQIGEKVHEAAKWGPLPDNFLTVSHVRRLCIEAWAVLKDKSPGTTFIRDGCTSVGDVFSKYGLDWVVAGVMDLIIKLLESDLEECRTLSDPLRLFIKDQAHKMSKIEEGRLRLIFGTGLYDQIVDRVLYEEMLKKEKQEFRRIPNKVGFSFVRGNTDWLVRACSQQKEWVSFDKKANDWTVAGWQMLWARELDERLLCEPDPVKKSLWSKLSLAREMAVIYGSIAFSDGTVLTKLIPGIMPSGRLLTISRNCKIVTQERILYDIAHQRETSAADVIAMGDDSVQCKISDPDEYVVWQKQNVGCTYTVESKVGPFESMNFCSHEWRKDNALGVFVPVPLNWELNMHTLCHPEEKKVGSIASTLRSLCIEYYFHPRFRELYSLAQNLAVSKEPEWEDLREKQVDNVYPLSEASIQSIVLAQESASSVDVCGSSALAALLRDDWLSWFAPCA